MAIAVLALVVGPRNAAPDAASGARMVGRIAGATAEAPPAAVTSPPTIGPHGDLVNAPHPPDADIATWDDIRRAHAGGLPRQPLLSGYRWPIHDARITNSYGVGRPGSFLLDGVTFHDGLDVSSFCGARITAAHDGVVLGAGRRTDALLGWVGDLTEFRAKLDHERAWASQAITVVVDDGNGYRSVYAHLGVAVVKRDAVIRAGDLVGYEGASGNATGCHLHYALFDPEADATLTLDPKIAKKTRLPSLELARIDPLLVLPPLSTAGITWGWGAR